MRNNISKNQSFLFSEVGCLKSNETEPSAAPSLLVSFYGRFHDFLDPHENRSHSGPSGSRAVNFVLNPRAHYWLFKSAIGFWIRRTTVGWRAIFRLGSDHEKSPNLRKHWFFKVFLLEPPVLLTQLSYDDGWTLVRNCIGERSIATIYNDHGPIHLQLVVRWIKWHAQKT